MGGTRHSDLDGFDIKMMMKSNVNVFSFKSSGLSKSQLISKCPFGVFKPSKKKKPTNFFSGFVP
jgi:hypothetical protein